MQHATARAELANPAHAEALSGLFERNSVSCHCQWWHFEGDKNAWLERCTFAPVLNRAAFVHALGTGGPHGIVALVGEEAIGWLKLTPASAVRKLYDQRFYRNLPCFGKNREGVLTVGCLLVDEPRRKQGVSRLLVGEAVARAAALGFSEIEAFPRCGESLRDTEVWTGPLQVYLDVGFRVVQEHSAYPVLRKALRA